MYCSQCGTRLDQRTGICPNCGLEHAMPDDINNPLENNTVQQEHQAPVQQYQYRDDYEYANEHTEYCDRNSRSNEYRIPYQYKPLGAWTYFWLTVLYNIPLIGFIFLIVHSFDDSNLNRRGYARSFWCALLVVVIIILAFVLIEVIFAVISVVFVSGASTALYY